ncbi:MAG: TorF family putative porin [Shimia sp.]|uniref:TorF family putative porin n=1 Tax=Shimia sp. TaxID=1954381 RepID=UPI004058B297
MKLLTTAAIAALCTPLVAGTASAQDWTWSYGADMTSNYIWAGQTQSDGGFAFQPWVTLENNGFYVTFWGSTVDYGAGDPDNWELDLYAGYYGDINENLSYDVGLARYAYDSSYYANSEVYGSLTYAFDNSIALTGYVAYDWENENTQYYVKAAYDINDKISVSARYGEAESADTDYFWDIGGSYAFNDTISMDLRYHGTDGMVGGSVIEDEGLVAMISVAF